MTAIFIGPYQDRKRLVHKLGCKNMPHPSQCTEVSDTSDSDTALARARSQAPSDAKIIELCKECWPIIVK